MHTFLILALAFGLANCIEYGESSHEEPHYSYEYAVHDPKTGDVHSRKEERKGGSTQGEYSVHEADGSKRIVQYTVHGKGGYSAQLDHGDTRYKSSGELQSYYKAGSSYQSSSSLKSAGFLESLPTFKGYKPSYEPSYKAPVQSYKPTYNDFKPSYSAPAFKPNYQAPLPSYKSSYPDPRVTYKPNYNAPDKRPFVPIFEPGYKPVLPSAAFQPALVTYQPTERAGYRPFAANAPAPVPDDYQSPLPNYQSAIPSYQPAIPSYQPAIPSYQPSIPSYQPNLLSYNNKPAFSGYKPSFPSYKAPVQSYEPSFPSYQSSAPSYKGGYESAPSYKPNYGQGTATSSVSFSTKGALVRTSTKHILPPKKHY